jgi:hypothetical protein
MCNGYFILNTVYLFDAQKIFYERELSKCCFWALSTRLTKSEIQSATDVQQNGSGSEASEQIRRIH